MAEKYDFIVHQRNWLSVRCVPSFQEILHLIQLESFCWRVISCLLHRLYMIASLSHQYWPLWECRTGHLLCSGEVCCCAERNMYRISLRPLNSIYEFVWILGFGGVLPSLFLGRAPLSWTLCACIAKRSCRNCSSFLPMAFSCPSHCLNTTDRLNCLSAAATETSHTWKLGETGILHSMLSLQDLDFQQSLGGC